MLNISSYVEFLKEMINIKIKEKEKEMKNTNILNEAKIDGELLGYKTVLSILEASKFLISEPDEKKQS